MSNIKIALVLYLAVWLVSTYATAQSIEKSVVATAGDSRESISYTVGEAMIESSGSIFISAGFQSFPFSVDEEILSAQDFTDQLTFYPNPTTRFVHIKGEQFNATEVRVRVFNIEGQEVLIPTTSKTSLTLDFLDQSSGIYYLLLEDQINKKTAKLKLVITK